MSYQRTFLKIGLFLSLNAVCFSAWAADYLPNGWIKSGSKANEYEITKDTQVSGPPATNSIQLRGAKNADTKGFMTLMQTIQAKQYLGKRIRFSAKIKSDQVKGWAGLWMRIDGKNNSNLGFDNMQNRKISGTHPWMSYSVVLDIPTGSQAIAFGILTSGSGSIWVDTIRFEVVSKTVPVTNLTSQPETPANLDLK